MAEVGNLEVELSLRDDLAIAVEKAVSSLRKLSDEADKATTRAKRAFDGKKKAAEDSARATDEDTKATQENAKAAGEKANAEKSTAAATQEAARATELDTKAAQDNTTVTKTAVKSKAEEAAARKEAAKAAKEAAQAKKEEEKAAKETAKAEVQAAKEAEQAQKAAADAQKRAAQEAKQNLQQLQGGLQQVAIGLGVVTAGLVYAAKQSVDAYNELRAAGMGLATVAARTGQDLGAVNEAAKNLSADGLMTMKEASTGLKNLLATGFSLDQAVNLMNAFRDAAAFGRQGSLAFGEAVQTATEGVKNGNSILVDNAGITKNLSVILREAGKSEQDLQNVQSDLSVRTALYNGILKEATLFQGDAAKMAGELSGKMSSLGAETEKAKANIGESLTPAVSMLLDVVKPAVKTFEEWTKANPQVASTLITVTTGATAAGAAVASLSVAVIGLMTVLGPVGLAITGAGMAFGALAGYSLNVVATGKAAEQTKDKLSGLVREYERLRGEVNDTTKSEEEHQKASDDLRKVLQQISDINPELVNGTNLNTAAIDKQNESLQTSIDRYSTIKGIVMWIWEHTSALDPFLGKMPESPAKQLSQAKETLDSLVAERDAYLKAYANYEYAQDYAERTWGTQIRDAQAKVLTLTAPDLSNDPEARLQELATRPNLAPPKKPGDNPPPGGGSEMSPALRAAMESLDDLKAYEQTPERLKQVLEKTREILRVHGAELQKLGKDRDLIRQRDITLPDQISQAEYNAAMAQLDADKTLKSLTPEQYASGLRDIKEKFQDYLKAHPDLSLQFDLKLKGASDEEIKAPLEKWRKQMQQAEQLGALGNDTLGMQARMRWLQEGKSIAITAGDQTALSEIVGQIRQLQQSMDQANFEARFKSIQDARDKAYASAAGQLAQYEKDLTDEEAKGDKADPQRIASIKSAMQAAVKPTLETERDALQALYDSIKGTDEQSVKQREQVERQLVSVKQELLDQEVNAHRIASDAKVAAEKQAADKRKDIQKDASKALEKAENEALTAFKNAAKVREDAIQRNIDLKEAELKQFDREISQQERLQKIEDAQKKIRDLEQSGAREQVIVGMGLNGQPVYDTRIVGMDEAQKDLNDAILKDQQQRHREQLQDDIAYYRDHLDKEKDANQQSEQALRDHFAAAKEALETGFDNMNTAQAEKLGAMVDTTKSKLAEMLGEYASFATNVNAELDKIKAVPTLSAPVSAPTSGSPSPSATTAVSPLVQAAKSVLAPGPGLSMLNLQVPTIPAALMQSSVTNHNGGTFAPTVNVPVTVPAGTSPATADLIGQAIGSRVSDAMRNLYIGFSEGKTSG